MFEWVFVSVIMIPPTLLVFGAGYAFSQAIGFGWIYDLSARAYAYLPLNQFIIWE